MKKSGDSCELGYLESSGTQYIDTGVPFESDVGFMVDGEIASLNDSWGCVAGSSDSNWEWYTEVWYNKYDNTRCNVCAESFSGDDYTEATVLSNGIFTAYMNFMNDGKNRVISESNDTTNQPTVIPPEPVNIGIFGAGSQTGGIDLEGNIRIRKFQITKGQTIIRDFIPFRIGDVGYLYDKITNTPYGNIGTGEFILGPEIKSGTNTLRVRVKNRYDTEENWTTNNPVLLSGETVFSIVSGSVDTTTKHKVGNGISNYKQLPFINDIDESLIIRVW